MLKTPRTQKAELQILWCTLWCAEIKFSLFVLTECRKTSKFEVFHFNKPFAMEQTSPLGVSLYAFG